MPRKSSLLGNKNPDPPSEQARIGHNPDIVFCQTPFAKHLFLEPIINTSDCEVIYLDFDLLYSGYVSTGMTTPPTTLLLHHPNRASWSVELARILHIISQERYLVIIDSLNTLNVLWNNSKSRRLASHSLMLMSSLGRKTGTHILAAAVGQRAGDDWKLLPGGRLMPGLNARSVPEQTSQT